MSGRDPLHALLDGIENSDLAWTAEDEDGPWGIFGIAPWYLDVGCPWFLGSDGVRKHRRFFLEQTRVYVAEMHRLYPMLVNVVDARNRDSLVYLRRAGFTIDKLIPHYGVEQRPFYRFSKVDPNV